MSRSHSSQTLAGYVRWLAFGWLGLVVAVGLAAPWLPLPYPPATPDLQHVAATPTWSGLGPLHYLGTDPSGRDVLAELVFGARQVVLLSLPATVLATVLGALAGGAAGFWGNRGVRLPLLLVLPAVSGLWATLALPGWQRGAVLLCGLGLAGGLSRNWLVRWGYGRLLMATWPLPLDSLLLSSTTLLGAVPRLVLVLALAAGPPLNAGLLLAVLALVAWPEAARLVRGQMLRVQALPFIEAARAAGLPVGRIWWRHAMPHACQPLWAFAPLSLAGLIGLESTLAFLGVGLPPTTPSWGHLLGALRQQPEAWWLVLGPGLALLTTLLALRGVAQRGQ
ncbi:MAG: ABC transporter permease [Janthinobacterium lividum]